MSHLLTTKAIAEHIGITQQRVLALIKSRNIPITMMSGRSPLIDSKHLKLFENRKPGNPHKKG